MLKELPNERQNVLDQLRENLRLLVIVGTTEHDAKLHNDMPQSPYSADAMRTQCGYHCKCTELMRVGESRGQAGDKRRRKIGPVVREVARNHYFRNLNELTNDNCTVKTNEINVRMNRFNLYEHGRLLSRDNERIDNAIAQLILSDVVDGGSG